jgi:curved DNA-binding protein CbpA
MGNGVSAAMFNPSHVRIYQNILKIASPATRVQMIETALTGQEYVSAAKHAGVYAHLLSYVTYYRRGVQPPALPGEAGFVGGGAAGGGAHLQGRMEAVGGQHGYATHPSLMNRAQGPASNEYRPASGAAGAIQMYQEEPTDAWQQVVAAPEKKAMNYFTSCLEVLGLKEDMSLTTNTLKAAYKKAAIRAHPDKAGGSEQRFQAVTKAYAYIADILKRVEGNRAGDGSGKAPQELSPLRDQREAEMDRLKHVEPVRLNPKQLNMETFNKMFEQTRLPDPDEDGYGDWLKSEADSQAPKFSQKFNKDVFNSMFEDESRRQGSSQLQVVHPQAMALTLNVGSGVELGRDRPTSYTAAANASMKYTDLRDAYTKENTFSGQVSGVKIEERSFERYKTQREAGPGTLTADEQHYMRGEEEMFVSRESARQRRAADQARNEDQYFERMKQLVLTSGGTQ